MKNKFIKILKKIFPFIALSLLIWIIFVRPSNKTLPVKTFAVENRVVVKSVSATGTIKSDNQANLSFGTTGEVVSVLVEKGEKVHSGQLLAVLNSSVQRQTTQAYKDARDAIQREIDLFEYNKKSNTSSLGGEIEYDLTLRKMKEHLGQAQASYQAQLYLLNNYTITAPFSGTTIDIRKKVGESAMIGETVAAISDLDNLVFTMYLDQEDFGFLKIGQNAKIELDAYPDHVFEGTLSEIPFFIQENTDSFEVEIEIVSNDFPIMLGMKGDARIILASTENEVSALSFDKFYIDSNNQPYVWVVENGLIAKRYIEIGLEGDIYSEILSENLDNMIIPLNRSITLEEGYKARIMGE